MGKPGAALERGLVRVRMAQAVPSQSTAVAPRLQDMPYSPWIVFLIGDVSENLYVYLVK